MDTKTLKQFAYIGAFLPEGEKERAKDRVRSITSTFENEYLHHLTLLFKPKADLEAVEKLLPWIGKEIQIKVTDLAQCVQPGHQVQAFLCELPSGLYCANKYPHITVSSGTKEDGKPVPPATSNALFESSPDPDPDLQWFGGSGSVQSNRRLAAFSGFAGFQRQPLILKARVGMFSHKKEVGIVYDLEEIQ